MRVFGFVYKRGQEIKYPIYIPHTDEKICLYISNDVKKIEIETVEGFETIVLTTSLSKHVSVPYDHDKILSHYPSKQMTDLETKINETSRREIRLLDMSRNVVDHLPYGTQITFYIHDSVLICIMIMGVSGGVSGVSVDTPFLEIQSCTPLSRALP